MEYEGEPVLILVDSLDEAVDAGGDDGAAILGALAAGVEAMPSWLKVVTTSRDEEHVLDKIKGSLSGVLEIKDVFDENPEDLREYVRAQLGDEATEEEIEAIVSASGGNFMYAVLLLRQGVAGDVMELLKEGQLPVGLPGLYSAMAERLCGADAGVGVALAVLAAAEGSLKRDEFAAGMKAGGVEDWEGVLEKLSGVVVEKQGVVQTYHKSFKDWLQGDGVSVEPLLWLDMTCWLWAVLVCGRVREEGLVCEAALE